MQCHGKCRLIHPRRIKCDKLSDYFPLYYFSAKYFRYKSKILLSLHVQWLTLIPITHLFSFTTHLRPQGYYNRHDKLSFDILHDASEGPKIWNPKPTRQELSFDLLHDYLSKTYFFALDNLVPPPRKGPKIWNPLPSMPRSVGRHYDDVMHRSRDCDVAAPSS